MCKYSKRTIFSFVLVLFLSLSAVSLVQAQEVKIPFSPPGPAALVSTNSVGGPDGFGYTFIDSMELSGPFHFFIDISGTGTDAGISLDDETVIVNTGFPFNYYGTIYNQVRISTNGWLSFGSSSTAADFSNDCPLPISLSAGAGARLAVLHDDLDLNNSAGQAVYYQTFPLCPTSAGGDGACTIIQWHNAEYWPTSDQFSFQVVLYENGNILNQYPAGDPGMGNSSTTGIQNIDATVGLNYACNTANSIPANLSVLFESPRPYNLDINQGSCAMTKNTFNNVHIEGVTPNKKVAMILGKELGPLPPLGGNACNGLQLDVKKNPRLLGIFRADALGEANVGIPIPNIDSLTHGYVQFIDIATCTKSEPQKVDIFISDINSADNDGDGILNCYDECPEEGLPVGPFEFLGRDGCIKDCIDIQPNSQQISSEEFMYCFPEELPDR